MGEKRNSVRACLIIGAAPCTSTDYINEFKLKTDCVICADGGESIAKSCGITPDYWIGDGDSLGCDTSVSNKVILPCEKDYTDLHCAVDLGLKLGYQRFYLCAVSGGRLDHFLANLCLLEYLESQGAIGILADAQNLCMLHHGQEMAFERNPSYQYVSLIPLDEQIRGVTLSGLKYSLNDAVLERKLPIGVSNEPIADRFSIRVDFGRALIVFSKDVSK